MAKRTIENVDVDDCDVNTTKKQRVEDTQYLRIPQIRAGRQEIKEGYADDDRKRKERKAAPVQDSHEHHSSNKNHTADQEMSDDEGETSSIVEDRLNGQDVNDTSSDEPAKQSTDASVAERIDSPQERNDISDTANDEEKSLFDGRNNDSKSDIQQSEDVVDAADRDIELFGDDGADEEEYDDVKFDNLAAEAAAASIYEGKAKKAKDDADTLAKKEAERLAKEKADGEAQAKADALSLELAWNAPYKEDKKQMKGWKKALRKDLAIEEDDPNEYFTAPSALYNHKHASFSNALFQALVPLLNLKDLEALCGSLKIEHQRFGIKYDNNAELCEMSKERCNAFLKNAKAVVRGLSKKEQIKKAKSKKVETKEHSSEDASEEESDDGEPTQELDLLPYFIEAMRLAQQKTYPHRPEMEKWKPYEKSIYLFQGLFSCLRSDLEKYHGSSCDCDPAIHMERIFDQLSAADHVKQYLEGLFGVERPSKVACPDCGTQQGDWTISVGIPKKAKPGQEFALTDLLDNALFEVGEPCERRCYVCEQQDPRQAKTDGKQFSVGSRVNISAIPDNIAVKIERGNPKKLRPNRVCLPKPDQKIVIPHAGVDKEYELVSVVKHDLNPSRGGQYRAYVQSNENWFCCYDVARPRASKEDEKKDDGKGRQAKVDALGFGEVGFSRVDHDDGYQTCLVFLGAVKTREKPVEEKKTFEEQAPTEKLLGVQTQEKRAEAKKILKEYAPVEMSLNEPVRGHPGCKRKVPRAMSPEDESDSETANNHRTQEKNAVEKEIEKEPEDEVDEEVLEGHASQEDDSKAGSEDDSEDKEEAEEKVWEETVVNAVAYKAEEAADGNVVYPRLLNSNGKRSLWDDDESEFSEYEYDDEEEEDWQQRQKVIEKMNNARNRFAPTWSRDGMDVAVS